MKNILLILLVLGISSLNGEEFEIEDVEFPSHSVQLSGSIVFPKNDAIHSAVVFVHAG